MAEPFCLFPNKDRDNSQEISYLYAHYFPIPALNILDLIVCLVLAAALWNGWRKGFIVQTASLVALVAGLWLAWHYGPAVGAWLRLDESVRAPGGFAVVLLAAILAVAVAGRVVRKIFRFVGFGWLDTALGIVVSVLKYLLLLSALFVAFDHLNADYSLVGRRTIDASVAYRPVMRLSKSFFPFVEQVSESLQSGELLEI